MTALWLDLPTMCGLVLCDDEGRVAYGSCPYAVKAFLGQRVNDVIRSCRQRGQRASWRRLEESEPIRVCVTGGRDFTDRAGAWRSLDMLLAWPGVSALISGMARGLDTIAAAWADSRKVPLIPEPVPAEDWSPSRYGKRAGHVRNQRMLDRHKPDLLVAFPGGNGTRDCTERGKLAGIPIWYP